MGDLNQLPVYETPLTPELKQRIYDGFSEHAIEATGIDGLSEDPISFEIRQGDDQVIGAVVAVLFWGQLHIKYVFVEKAYRGKGLARRLMEHAFDYGRQRGCDFTFVETMNFQAPEFYQKLGFEMEFIREGFVKNTSFCYLRKGL